jgi:hypothetical protein
LNRNSPDDINDVPKHRAQSRVQSIQNESEQEEDYLDEEENNSPTARPPIKYPRAPDIMTIVRGNGLSSKSNAKCNQTNKRNDRRENFKLQNIADPKERELWRRLFEAVVLDHIQRGPVSSIMDPEMGCVDPMIRDIKKRYHQMFGEDAPELTTEQLRAVSIFTFQADSSVKIGVGDSAENPGSGLSSLGLIYMD